MEIALYLVAVMLMIIGVAGVVLPALPGLPLVFGGILLWAWTGDFAQVGVWTLVYAGVLMVIATVLDFIAGMLGVQQTGASTLAVIGSGIGALFGLFFGIVGLLLGPFVGAVLGEMLAQELGWAKPLVASPQVGQGSSPSAPATLDDHALLPEPVDHSRAGAETPKFEQAVKAGLGAWVGFIVGSVVKIVISFAMIGGFLLALIY